MERTFLTEITTYRRLLLDTNILIYFLEGIEPYQKLLFPLFQMIEKRQLQAVISVVTEIELLVKPIRENNTTAIELVMAVLAEFPNLETVAVNHNTAQKAAGIRAQKNLTLPDAIILATAIETNCDAALTNDNAWRNVLKDCKVLILNEYLR